MLMSSVFKYRQVSSLSPNLSLRAEQIVQWRKRSMQGHIPDLLWISLPGWDELHPRMKGSAMTSMNINLVDIVIMANDSNTPSFLLPEAKWNWEKGIWGSLISLGPPSENQKT